MNSASSDQCEERGMDMVLSLGGAGGGVYKRNTLFIAILCTT